MDKATKTLIKAVISNSYLLEEAEAEVKRLQEENEKLSTAIEEQTGCALYQRSLNSPRCFWKRGVDRQKSIEYATEADALKALLNNQIEWK
jgi:hypothetical protein